MKNRLLLTFYIAAVSVFSWSQRSGIVQKKSLQQNSNAIGKFDGNGVPKLGGNFTSPVYNNVSYTFTQRALNQPQENYDFYYHITVVKDCPFTAQNATVIPWFNQEGNGQQTMWKIPLDEKSGYPLTWNQLAEQGYIKITIVDNPSGKFEQTEGKTIP